jgi:hypothetical protein
VSHDQEAEPEQEHSQMLRHLLSSFVQHGSSSSGNHGPSPLQQQQQGESGSGRLQSWFQGFRSYVTRDGRQQLPQIPEQQQQQQRAAAGPGTEASLKDPSRSSAADRSSTDGGSGSAESVSDTAGNSSSTGGSEVSVFQRQQQQQQQLGGALQRSRSTRSLPGPDELRSLATVSAPASYWNMRNMLPVTNGVIDVSHDMLYSMLHDMADCEELWEDAHSLAALPMLPASLVGATIHHAGITGVCLIGHVCQGYLFLIHK